MTPERSDDGLSDQTDPDGVPATTMKRRTLLAAGLAGGVGVAAGFGGARVASASDAGPDAPELTYPFRGEHQQGITTPAQQQMHITAFDVTTDDRDALIALLTEWSRAAENLTAGLPVGALRVSRSAPPADTGEVHDLEAAGLTVTFGFGRTLFRDDDGNDRFGLADQLPAPLAEDIPRMAAEKIDAGRSGGDLVVQACAEDPLVALHAVRNLTRIAFGTATVRWTQLGYGRVSSTGAEQTTARNLFGFKDGTANIKAEDAGVADAHVWVSADDGPAWHTGGSYLVARNIRMLIESWDRVRLEEQEQIFGRTKGEGGPLSGGAEFDAPDFAAPPPSGATSRPRAWARSARTTSAIAERQMFPVQTTRIEGV